MKKNTTPRPMNWNATYIILLIIAAILFAVGQWSGAITTVVLTLILGRLVLIEKHLALIAFTPLEEEVPTTETAQVDA